MLRALARQVSLALGIGLLAACSQVGEERPADVDALVERSAERPPNIVIIYADDVGYGDIGSYGATGVDTPRLDELATNGLRFTDAHASAATCTPSRYSLLTGEYGFRSRAEILPGDAPLLIRTDALTLPGMLRKAGYATGVVGKWHLGLGVGEVDWNEDVAPGPLEIGFDYSFLLPATGDRVPTVFLENRRVVGLDPADPITVSYKGDKIGERPTGVERPDLLKQQADRQHSDTIVNGISRIGHMAGGTAAEWVDEDFADVFTGKSVEFMTEHKEQPFFLFVSLHDIHVPRIVAPRFEGASAMGPRGNTIAQMDWMVGALVDSIAELGLAEDTIVIFTSDNGPVLDDGYADQAVEKLGEHKPSGPFRGGKYSAYEAGTRMPQIISWPGTIAPDGESDALVSQVDYLASFARLAGVSLEAHEAIDSMDMLAELLGYSKEGREVLFKESVGTVSLRKGNQKYIRAMGRDARIPGWLANKDIETGLMGEPQLFDLGKDIAEQNNLAGDQTNLASEMDRAIRAIEERTTAVRN